MAIQRYSKQEMHAIISSILNKEVTLLPIGNHELRRHLVYRVKTEDGDFVFKYYYQDIYGGREISTLRLLKDSTIKHPSLINSGTFGAEREWLMMELLNGMPFNKIICKIPTSERVSIYKDMGRELGKLHELKTFKYYGSLNEDLTFFKEYSSYKEAFLSHNKYVFDKIEVGNLSNQTLLSKGLEILKEQLHLLDNVKESRLTHSDYCPRNIFVSKENGKRVLKAVLDFELCRPWDKNADFCHLYLKNFPNNKEYEEAFFSGYHEVSSLDENYSKTFDLYMINLCLSICSWAEDMAPEYYNLALSKLEHIINK